MFGRSQHAGQLYGNIPYECHLIHTALVAKTFGLGAFIEAACHLHDILEDTTTERSTLVDLFGEEMADVVWCCTGVGVNRKARNKAIYSKISENKQAQLVKLCDRIANLEHSVRTDNVKILQMYAKEAYDFGVSLSTIVIVSPIFTYYSQLIQDTIDILGIMDGVWGTK